MVRFDYYTKGYIIDSFKKTDYAIYALAEMKNKVIDDYLYSLMTHPNVMYRQNDLFKYKNYDHSAYLTKLMKTEPEIRTISEKVPELIVTDVATASKGGSAKWVLSGNTNGVAWSNDGTYLATAGQYSAFFTPEGEEKKLLDKTRWAYDVDFSPSEKLVAIAYHGDTIGIYDTKTGKLLHNFKEHEGVPQGVRKIKFSPDGKQLASVSNDRSLIVRDAATGYNLHTIEFTSDANTVAWLPEKDRLIVGTDKNLHLINIQTDSIVKSVNFDGVAEIQVLSKGKDYFIVAGGSGGLVIFNKKLTVVHKFAAKNIARIRFSVDQKTMYTLCWEDKKNGLWMWDLKTYKAKKAEGCAIGKGYAMDIRRSDGTIAIAGSSGLVQLFDKNLQLLTKSASIAFHKNTVYALAYSGTRKTLYSADADGGVIAWSEGEASKTVFFEKGISLIESLVLSPDEKFLFIGANKKIIRLDLDASRYHAIPTEDRCRALIADGETVFAAATTWVLKIDKQGRVKQSDTYSPTMHNAALLTKQNIFIGGGFLKETLTLWNATTLKQLRSFNVPVKERSDGVYDICLTSDEKLLYTSGSDGVIRVYSTSTWEIIKTLVEVSSKDHIACNENNTLLATASDSIVSLYETKSFKKIGQARLPANVSALLFVHNVLIIGLLTGKIMKIVIKHL
jgi:WD40 repeat protein